LAEIVTPLDAAGALLAAELELVLVLAAVELLDEPELPHPARASTTTGVSISDDRLIIEASYGRWFS
jgi:hypothetical protein